LAIIRGLFVVVPLHGFVDVMVLVVAIVTMVAMAMVVPDRTRQSALLEDASMKYQTHSENMKMRL
jgi:Tfp pilus assembly protein PilX